MSTLSKHYCEPAHPYLHVHILQIRSHAESLNISPAPGQRHSYALQRRVVWMPMVLKGMCFPKQVGLKEHGSLHLALHGGQWSTMNRGFMTYWYAKVFPLDVFVFTPCFIGKHYFPAGVVLLLQLVHKVSSQQFSAWAENFSLAKSSIWLKNFSSDTMYKFPFSEDHFPSFCATL